MLIVHSAELADDLVADLLNILAVSVNNDVCGRFIFGPAPVHEALNEIDVLVVFEEGTAVIVLKALQNGFRISCQKNDPAVSLHLSHIAVYITFVLLITWIAKSLLDLGKTRKTAKSTSSKKKK